MGAVIQARPEWSEVLDGMGGCCWVALSDARKTIVKPVRCCSIAAYRIALSYITFMTHLSVSILFYKYNVWLEIEMRVMAGNSSTVFKSKFSVKLHQNLNNLLWGTEKEQSHMASPLSWEYTGLLLWKLQSLRYSVNIQQPANDSKTYNSVLQLFIILLLWDRPLADLNNLNSTILYVSLLLKLSSWRLGYKNTPFPPKKYLKEGPQEGRKTSLLWL